MRVDNVNDKFFIEFNKNILNEKEIIELVEYLKTKEIIYKTELQKKDIEKLDNELKQNQIRLKEMQNIPDPEKVPVVLIEAQVGEYTGEDDIVRIEDDFERK